MNMTVPRGRPLPATLVLIILLPLFCAASQPAEPFQWIRTGPGLSLHKDMFMLPATISSEYDGARTEAVFQISAKHEIFNTRIYFGYTQISFWQAYDQNNSAPFRETDYNPEIFYRSKSYPFGSASVAADIGFEHESNGQRPPLSRSWNLFYVAPYYYNSNLLLYLKVRYRFPEDKKPYPNAAVGDDNPDITDYLGYTDLHLFYRFAGRQMVHLTLRGNIGKGRGSVALNYGIPIPHSEMSFFLLRLSHGYGESLVDYKRDLTRFGIGIMFSR